MDLEHIGQRIRQHRKAQGRTLDEVSRSMGITLQRLGQIERGGAIRVDQLTAASLALGIPTGELLGEAVETARPPSVEHLGRRIRLRRVELDLTQGDLGEAIDMPYQQLHRIEAGKRSLRVEQLAAIAGALRCPMGYLLGEVPHPEGGWLAESGGKD